MCVCVGGGGVVEDCPAPAFKLPRAGWTCNRTAALQRRCAAVAGRAWVPYRRAPASAHLQACPRVSPSSRAAACARFAVYWSRGSIPRPGSKTGRCTRPPLSCSRAGRAPRARGGRAVGATCWAPCLRQPGQPGAPPAPEERLPRSRPAKRHHMPQGGTAERPARHQRPCAQPGWPQRTWCRCQPLN